MHGRANAPIRILYVSAITPDESCGAHLAMCRHLVHRKNFDTAVLSTNAANALTDRKMSLAATGIKHRLLHSRIAALANNLDYVMNWSRLDGRAVRFAADEAPDIILSVPDNWHLGVAVRLAKRLGKPLALNFQDLSPISNYLPGFMRPFPPVRSYLTRMFRRAHRSADLVFYTSEGMRDWFEPHPNGHILYPMGDWDRPVPDPARRAAAPGARFRVVYAGNCYGAYGRMLLGLARMLKNSAHIDLKIYPVGAGWAERDIREMRQAGIYQHFLPFGQLRPELEKADAFLTAMSFEPSEAPFVKTSFTTKWLDYAPYARPIVVWAPSYSTAAGFAVKNGCGLVIDDPDPVRLASALLDVSRDGSLRRTLGEQAAAVSETLLNPRLIHGVFVDQITRLAGPRT